MLSQICKTTRCRPQPPSHRWVLFGRENYWPNVTDHQKLEKRVKVASIPAIGYFSEKERTTVAEAVLISLRDPDDAMAEHERMCFAECARVPIDAVKMHHIANSFPPIQRLEEIGCVFFGGSGAYSVLDDLPWIHQTVDLMLAVVDRRIPAYASCFGFQGLSTGWDRASR